MYALGSIYHGRQTMNSEFSKFLRCGIDLSCCGLICDNDFYAYFCTPKNAAYLGRAGVDGIHFCFIKGFGGMVFSVSPMNSYPDYVFPVAETFNDFLRLIISCGDTAAIEQAHFFDRGRFYAFLDDIRAAADSSKTYAIKMLTEKQKLLPIDDPYAYIISLQQSFDYSKIKYTDEFYDIDMNPSAPLPEWKVSFGSGFTDNRKSTRAGHEYRIMHNLSYAGASWQILSLYHTGKGVVADILAKNANPELCNRFAPSIRSGETNIPSEQHLFAYSSDNSIDIHAIRQHYCISDDIKDFTVIRCFFNGSIRKKAFEENSLTFVFSLEPSEIPGKSFTVHEPGESINIESPDGNMVCTLTVNECRKASINADTTGAASGYFIPQNYFIMSYSIDPPDAADAIVIRDISAGDQPLAIYPADEQNEKIELASSAAIIGGADGPTVMVAGSRTVSEQGKHTVLSSLYFEAPDEITWVPIFHVKPSVELDVPIRLPSGSSRSSG